MRARRLLTLVSLCATGLFSFGCGDISVGDPAPAPPTNTGPSGLPTPPGLPDEPDQPKLPPGPLAEVSGVYRTTFITEHGDIPGPPPPSSLQIAALVPDGEGFITYPGELAADGTFHVPGVPDGLFYLRVGPSNSPQGAYLVTSARKLDLSTLAPGRPDLAPTTKPTPLLLTADGLVPEGLNGELIFQSLDGVTSGLFNKAWMNKSGAPVTDLPFDGTDTGLALPLIQASKGDVAHVFETRFHALYGGAGYLALTRSLDVGTMEMVDGAPTTITGTLHEAPKKSLSVSWKGTEFVALLAEVNPSSILEKSLMRFDIRANPAGPGLWVGEQGTQALAHGTFSPADVDGQLTYGNPFPSSWNEVAVVSVTYRVPAASPDKGTYAGGQARVGFALPVEALGSAPIAPRLRPPGLLTLDGKDIRAELNGGVSATPVIAWQKPILGTPKGYRVTVVGVLDSGGAGRLATFRTKKTSLRLPPGLLEAGQHFALIVTAYDGVDPDGLGSTADAMSGLISP
jgi:hypothetical protein